MRSHDRRPGSRYAREASVARRLADLIRGGVELRVVCRRCRNSRLLFPRSLADTLGAGLPLDELARRLRCTGCGERGSAAIYEVAR